MAVTPLTLQVKVKKHIQLILERLLHTVNRRVIVLDRENSLRVSTTAATARCVGVAAAPLPMAAFGRHGRCKRRR